MNIQEANENYHEQVVFSINESFPAKKYFEISEGLSLTAKDIS